MNRISDGFTRRGFRLVSNDGVRQAHGVSHKNEHSNASDPGSDSRSMSGGSTWVMVAAGCLLLLYPLSLLPVAFVYERCGAPEPLGRQISAFYRPLSWLAEKVPPLGRVLEEGWVMGQRWGGQVNAADVCGFAPLILAQYAFDPDSRVPLVLAAGADPQARDHKGRTCDDHQAYLKGLDATADSEDAASENLEPGRVPPPSGEAWGGPYDYCRPV